MSDYLTKEDVKTILFSRQDENPYKKLQTLPLPSQLADAKKGAARVAEAISKNQKIIVVGDYDVDGIISTAIMLEFFEMINFKAQYFIPNRFKHGYGLSKKVIEEILRTKKGCDVIITVDNGISSFDAAKACKDANIDLIITDHHTVGEILPDAFAVINPKRNDCCFPYKNICGAQVAWYFCAAIKNEIGSKVDMSHFFDFLCVAIISDIMPMQSMNYTIAKKGLYCLSNSSRVPLKYLFTKFARQNLKSDDIGFLLSPLLNSAGRLDDPSIALDFLMSKTQIQASKYLDRLISLNEQRKSLQRKMLQEALNEVDDLPVICVWNENWNEGVIGIIASNLAQKYKRPSFVFSISGDTAKGSARNLGGVNLYELLDLSSDLLLGFGGHKSAAGLSLKVENLEKLKYRLCDCVKNISFVDSIDRELIFGAIKLDLVDAELYDIIHSFEPFGLENEKPIFLIEKTKIKQITLFGRNLEFSKLIVVQDLIEKEITFFDEIVDLQEGDEIDIIGTISKSTFGVENKIQILAKELIKIKK